MNSMHRTRRAWGGLSILAMLCSVTGFAGRASGQQPIIFPPDETTAVMKGSITGDQGQDYLLRGKAGQKLDVKLESSNMSMNFNVTDRERVAIDVEPSPREVREWSGNLPSSGDFLISVYFTRAARDRGDRGEFTLIVTLSGSASGGGKAGGGRGGAVRIDQLDYETGGTGDYWVDDELGNRNVSKVRVFLQPDRRARISVTLDGDGFIMHGTWSQGRGNVVNITLTHGYDRAELVGGGSLVLRNEREFESISLDYRNSKQNSKHRLNFKAAMG